MRVVIAGGHGKIGLKLTRLLSARGDDVVALIRDPGQADDVLRAGATPTLCDLEAVSGSELAELIGSADAAVFAAGAGPGSGARRKETVDYGAAVKLIEAARALGTGRYVIVSSMRADAGHPGEEVFDAYLRAKGRADDALRASGLAYTIVRPGRLTDAPATGLVTLAPSVERGEISRDDVAAVLAAVLGDERTAGAELELVGGETPIEQAIASIAS